MTDELFGTHPNFNSNLSFLCVTPTTLNFRFPQDRSFDHFGAYASKNLEQFFF